MAKTRNIKLLGLATQQKTAWEGGLVVWPDLPHETPAERQRLSSRIRRYLLYNDFTIPDKWRVSGRPRRLL